jgi:hypothetical protein
MELKKVRITNVSRKEKYSEAKKKNYTSLGLQTEEYGEKWLSGFDGAQTRSWKPGDIVEIEIEEKTTDKGTFLNFNVPKGAGGQAPSNAGTAEIKNMLEFKVIPMLEALRKEQIIITGRLNQALGADEEEFRMPDFREDDREPADESLDDPSLQ